jgi:very-short-patch-repair endonuclease
VGTYRKGAAGRARYLRENLTDAERKLWSVLRNRRLEGSKFVRQLPIGPYVADFACREQNLIVEVDGGQHSGSATDEARTQALAGYGYAVLRFWNNDVLQNLDGVAQTILARLAKAPSPGRFAVALSPEGRGESVRSSGPDEVDSSP